MTLLAADNLHKRFVLATSLFGAVRRALPAVAGVDLWLDEGETLGLVGESGCGKSTLARLLCGLHQPDQGRVVVQGKDLAKLRGRDRKALHRDVQMVFQDPFSSLNPRLPISAILEEPLLIHRFGTRRQRRERIGELLLQVGLDRRQLDRYPHEFSGGQRQRIAIARALALRPKLIIADEPVSALDVSVQSQILNLMSGLKAAFNLSYVFISHDLAVVEHLADRVAVMYLGRIIEQGPRDPLFAAPAHPYTRALLDAVPRIRPKGKQRSGLPIGDVPNPLAPPPGCPYHPRCPRAQPRCREQEPPLAGVPGRPAAHTAACHFPLEARPCSG